MPSLPFSESNATLKDKNKKDKKKKKKNMTKDQSPINIEQPQESIGSKSKKSPKLGADLNPHEDGVSGNKNKAKKKKRKASDSGMTEESSSEVVEPKQEKNNNKKKKSKKAKLEEPFLLEDEAEEKKKEDPIAVSRFRITEPLTEKLKEKGIESLFPIQAMTFDTILDGSDLVGRARTGQGKTLAFVLPILESLTNGPTKASRKTGYGRTPSVLVLLPTRELACQVNADFEVYGGAMGLISCLYGGAPYQGQEIKLRRGVDIVVGTPGRIKDHIERENIDLSQLKCRVLDEADEMLRMGFVDGVELNLAAMELLPREDETSDTSDRTRIPE